MHFNYTDIQMKLIAFSPITSPCHPSFPVRVWSELPRLPLLLPFPKFHIFLSVSLPLPCYPSRLCSPPSTALSLDPSSSIPHLCNSHFASLSSPFPIPPLSLWGVAVMRWKAILCISPHSVHHLSIWLNFSLPLWTPPPPHPLQSLWSSTAQNANGLLMDPCFL